MVETQTQDTSRETEGGAIVRVDNLVKVFRDFWGRPKARAVNGVNFEVRTGEVFGLLGPNGSGKSTTIKMMLGLLNPTKGFIDIFGQSPRDVKTKERIGYLPEESYLYKYLNSTETLDFFGGLFALDSKEKKIRSEQLLDMVGLTATQMRTVGEFSKGMQRRIGLAQALINDPDLVILDEPTSGLDPVGCREIKDLILNLKARGKTVILSSHLLADVEDVCDRAVIYYGGKIQQYGTLEELLTERDTIRFTLPALSEKAQQEVMNVLGKHVAKDQVRVENPTQNLESFFLNVVENAIAKDEGTSGSTAGNEVAEFLRADDPLPTQADKMLERLAEKESAKTVPTPAEPVPEKPKVDTAKLDSLSGDETKKELVKRDSGKTKQSQSLDEADDKLSGLLGGD
ncbi:MAG: ABC transporter ATP-binding protein [Verrucomicrobia subdivision 3 bacterium]|nr:ABC transporter ATP-binding protein [Limisphaerales bacterium]